MMAILLVRRVGLAKYAFRAKHINIRFYELLRTPFTQDDISVYTQSCKDFLENMSQSFFLR